MRKLIYDRFHSDGQTEREPFGILAVNSSEKH